MPNVQISTKRQKVETLFNQVGLEKTLWFASRLALRLLPHLSLDKQKEPFDFWEKSERGDNLLAIFMSVRFSLIATTREFGYQGDINDEKQFGIVPDAPSHAKNYASRAPQITNLVALSAANAGHYSYADAYPETIYSSIAEMVNKTRSLENIFITQFLDLDLIALEKGMPPHELHTLNLWHGLPLPNAYRATIDSFTQDTLDQKQHFEVWLDWLKDRLESKPLDIKTEQSFLNVDHREFPNRHSNKVHYGVKVDLFKGDTIAFNKHLKSLQSSSEIGISIIGTSVNVIFTKAEVQQPKTFIPSQSLAPVEVKWKDRKLLATVHSPQSLQKAKSDGRNSSYEQLKEWVSEIKNDLEQNNNNAATVSGMLWAITKYTQELGQTIEELDVIKLGNIGNALEEILSGHAIKYLADSDIGRLNGLLRIHTLFMQQEEKWITYEKAPIQSPIGHEEEKILTPVAKEITKILEQHPNEIESSVWQPLKDMRHFIEQEGNFDRSLQIYGYWKSFENILIGLFSGLYNKDNPIPPSVKKWINEDILDLLKKTVGLKIVNTILNWITRLFKD